MPLGRVAAILAAFGLAALGFTPVRAVSVVPPPSGAGPILRFAHVPGHTVSLAGRGWAPRASLSLAVQVGSIITAVQFRTTVRGRFLVAVDRVSLCDRPIFVARDLAAHQITLRGPALGCPSQASPPVPLLAVIHGRRIKPRVVHLRNLNRHALTLRLGDILRIDESGTGPPAFIPHADSRYLAPVGAGVPSVTSCSAGSCPDVSVWRFLAVRPGTTGIDLAPVCRLTKPQCELPDLLVRVTIAPIPAA